MPWTRFHTLCFLYIVSGVLFWGGGWALGPQLALDLRIGLAIALLPLMLALILSFRVTLLAWLKLPLFWSVSAALGILLTLYEYSGAVLRSGFTASLLLLGVAMLMAWRPLLHLGPHQRVLGLLAFIFSLLGLSLAFREGLPWVHRFWAAGACASLCLLLVLWWDGFWHPQASAKPLDNAAGAWLLSLGLLANLWLLFS